MKTWQVGCLAAVVVLVALMSSCGVEASAYIYGDGTFDYGTNLGLYRVNAERDRTEYTPEVIWSTDDYELEYLGGCVDTINNYAYLLLGQSAGEYAALKFDLNNNNTKSQGGSFSLCYDADYQKPLIALTCVLNPADNSSAILTGCEKSGVSTLYLLDPASGNITTVGDLPMKFDYNPGSMAYNPATATVYFTLEKNFMHSQTTVLTVDLVTGNTTTQELPEGTITREMIWDPAHSRIVAMNQTYHFLGPFATDPFTHITIINPDNFTDNVQRGEPPIQIPLPFYGLTAISLDGSRYFHAGSNVLSAKNAALDGIYEWDLYQGNRTFKGLGDLVQPQSFLGYVELSD